MQVFVETTSGLERRLTVGVPAERVESEVNSRLQKAAKNIRLDGFRPGKVPMTVIRQRFGPGVRQEVVGEVMNQSFYEAVNQENLRPAGQPSIEPKTLEAGKDLEYIATFEIFPEIELNDMNGIAVEKPKSEVTAADINEMIAVFRKQQGSMESVDRPAQDGDQVTIDYVGTKGGEEFEGGSAEGSDLVLGSSRMIPGFESGIEGMRAGDEKTLALSFPEEYHSEDLKGAAVEFKITLQDVKEQVLASLDDELFAKYGVEEGGEDKFREEIAQNMERELTSAVKNALKKQVMDSMYEAHSGQDVPKALIDGEIKNMRSQMLQQVGGGGAPDMDLEALLPVDMLQEQAERRVKLGLILNKFVSKEELKPDAGRVRSTIEEMASTYQEPEEVISWYYSNQEQLAGVESTVLEDQIVDKLLENATITEKEYSYQDALSQGRENQ